MASAPAEVFGAEIHGAEFGEIFRPYCREFIKQPGERLALAFANVSPAVERLERAGFAEFEEPSRARNPVGALTVDEMADDIEGAPGIFALVTQSPFVRQPAQQRVKHGGSVGKKHYGVV